MSIRLIRIGNSQGVRIPKPVLAHYGMAEGDDLQLEETREGILLRKPSPDGKKLSYRDSYVEMVAENVDDALWEEWDTTAGDGLDD